MKKYYKDDTGGKYLVSAESVGFFADVQTVAQAVDAARIWRAMTGDNGKVIIWSRETVEKIMRREEEK